MVILSEQFMNFLLSTAAVLSLCSSARAAVVRTCPSSDVCYSLSIPNESASSGSGDIYFQLTSPTTNQYVALGQGFGMAGSNMFVMYTSSDGNNVTVSPRLGTGNVMPQHDTTARIEVLSGSGVRDGIMTANVRCRNCDRWNGGSMNFAAPSASWIYAVRGGPGLDSDDLDESIGIHDSAASFTFDLSRAIGGRSGVNPFEARPQRPTSSSSGTEPSSRPSTTSSASKFGGPSSWDRIVLAHGLLASLAFVALFPVGGILIRVASFPNTIWVHAALQASGLVLYVSAFGLGVLSSNESPPAQRGAPCDRHSASSATGRTAGIGFVTS